jgi:hypothetical protein
VLDVYSLAGGLRNQRSDGRGRGRNRNMVSVAYEASQGKTKERISGICSTDWRDERGVQNIIRKLSEVTA